MEGIELVKCEDCTAWDINPQDLNTGLCLRKSPHVFIIPTHQGPGTMTVFPQTRRGMGCIEGIWKSNIKLQS